MDLPERSEVVSAYELVVSIEHACYLNKGRVLGAQVKEDDGTGEQVCSPATVRLVQDDLRG